MTTTDAGVHSGQLGLELPGHEYMAVRLTGVYTFIERIDLDKP